jgi:hypothetical protein
MKLAAGASPLRNARVAMSILHEGATAAPHSSHRSLIGQFRILIERDVEVAESAFPGVAATNHVAAENPAGQGGSAALEKPPPR